MTAGPARDKTVVHKAGRTAALQASLALAAVLVIVGAVVFGVDVRVQNQQIRSQLVSVAASADDVTDPPPGMILALRDVRGQEAIGAHPEVMQPLLDGPAGFFDVTVDDIPYRAYVTDEPDGRVVAALDLAPYLANRSRLLLALGVAELAGILASIAVVVLLTRRSIRPLAEALALQRRFVADASHELRAPLTVLATRAQLLARRAPPGQQEQFDALVEDARALGDVIEDLLASAAMSAASTPRADVDMGELSTEVCAGFAELAAAAGVDLTTGPREAGGELVVSGSAPALKRALGALVDNALAHEHPGGSVVVTASAGADTVAVEVRDDGVGVDPDAVDRLFERFAHGDHHTTGRTRYGIGLALVREIAVAHGGDVTVGQTPGGGATFTLTLPAARPASRRSWFRRPG
ncbi:sensor histidine kinase [Mycolicibacterium palauense]|uniref:sensor histidine kinase n=1 Tax=Mycolicibacterium palauense TaxID=2034511 RepID=UPI001FEA2171|nr:HAMP domain-containing sensor histidine kinase [Mycolicibacterium palauense]